MEPSENMTRQCKKCLEVKPLDFFAKEKNRKDGFSVTCRICVAARRRDLRKENIEERRGKERIYRQKKEKIISQQKTVYWHKNKEDIVKKKKEWRQKNIERIKEQEKSYRERNKERKKALDKKYRSENREKLRKYLREYYMKNPSACRERNRKNSLKQRVSLADSYVSMLLKRFFTTEITNDIIELKKDQLKIYRAIKEAKNGVAGTRNQRTADDEQENNRRDNQA